MKQKVNLYRAPKKEPTTGLIFSNMVKGLGALMAVFVLVSLYQWIQGISHSKELRTLEQKKGELELKAKELENAPGREKMLADLKVLREQEAQSKQILATLASLKKQEVASFSGYLRAFSSQTVQGLWLTKFSLAEGGNYLGFKGIATEASFVPKLIEGLSQELVFRGKAFEVFKLVADPDSKRLKFVLETDKNEKFDDEKQQKTGVR